MIAAAEFDAAIFHDADAAPLRTVGRRQLLQPDDRMRDAVHGLVGDIGGQIVEQHHGGVVSREVMLDRQDLPPVPQRVLRQQANLRKAVEHDAARLHPLDGLENLLGGLTELQVGRIQQALLLFGIQQAFRRQQLEDVDAVIQRPAVGGRAVAQFALGLGQRDIEALFSGARAFQQELQRDRGLAGPRRAFHQEKVTAGQPA